MFKGQHLIELLTESSRLSINGRFYTRDGDPSLVLGPLGNQSIILFAPLLTFSQMLIIIQQITDKEQELLANPAGLFNSPEVFFVYLFEKVS